MNEDLFDLRLDGFVLNETDRIMYGKCNEIEVLVELYCRVVDGKMTHRISTSLDVGKSLHKDEFIQSVHSFQEKYDYVTFAGCLDENVVAVVVLANRTDARAYIETMVEELTALCNVYHMENNCEMCDNKDNLLYIDLQGDKKLICQSCYSKLQNEVVRVEKQRKENVFLGFIGAIIGAMIGSILWILLDQIGFIAGIAGYAIVYCCIKGYSMLGKTISKKGIVICVIVCLLMVIFADGFSLGISIYKEFNTVYSITFADALALVPVYLTEGEILKSLVFNLVIGYLFVIWASYSFIANLWKATDKINQPIKFKRL